MARLYRVRGAACLLTLAAAVVFGGVRTARAGTIVLGDSGWEAVFDDSLDPYVDIIVDLVTDDAVFIEKSAEFIQPPGPAGFPPIPIVFRQIAYPAVSQIVINDEIIINSTGVDWTDFHIVLLDGGDAAFNPDLTNASGGGLGFSTSPFDNQMFSDDNSMFWVDGFGLGPGGSDAVVPAGGVWFPGLIGELYIDVVPSPQAPFTVFTLKEMPTPEPTTLLLLLAVVLAHARRPCRPHSEPRP